MLNAYKRIYYYSTGQFYRGTRSLEFDFKTEEHLQSLRRGTVQETESPAAPTYRIE